jgi:hypothetical protein
MKLLVTLVAVLALAACATNPNLAPATAGAKMLAQHSQAIEVEYIATLKSALAIVRTPSTDPRVSQGIQNAVTDCGRVFDQLDHATTAVLTAKPDEIYALSKNLDDVLLSAERSLKNLHAMMRAKP